MPVRLGINFSPVYLQPALWLDGADSSKLFTTSGGSTLAGNGDPVGRWEDKSGNNRHMIQTTSGSRPTRLGSVINSQGVVRFDGSDDTMLLASGKSIAQNVSGLTLIAAIKWTTIPTANKTIFIASLNGNTALARAALAGGNVSQKFNAGGRRLESDGFQSVSSASNITTNATIHSAVFDYANSNLYQFINSKLDGSTESFQTDGSTTNSPSAEVAIGSSSGGGAYADADIAEIIIYQRALTTTERQNIERYLSNKWAIALT